MKYKYEPNKFRDLFNAALGQSLWKFLCEPDNRIRMETATDLRHPAVEGIDRQLSLRPDAAVLREADRVKQMIGHMTRQLMEHWGFVLDQPRVNLRTGKIFSTGSRYERRDDSSGEPKDTKKKLSVPGRSPTISRKSDAA